MQWEDSKTKKLSGGGKMQGKLIINLRYLLIFAALLDVVFLAIYLILIVVILGLLPLLLAAVELDWLPFEF